MQNLKISESVLAKLKDRHKVIRAEVEQCFSNLCGNLLTDTRVAVATMPPTLWFIACTNKGRPLKIVYIQKGSLVELKTAYDPNEKEIGIYKRFG